MQPFGEQEIDLTRILAQRREAGRIPRNKESGPNAFTGIQLHLRGGNPASPVRAPRQLPPALSVLLLLALPPGAAVMFLKLQNRLGQRVAAQRDIHDYRDDGRQYDA